MPRGVKQATRSLGARTLVVDNGAHTIKAGFVAGADNVPSELDCRIIPNCLARGGDGPRSSRIYTGSELDQCKDFAEMTFKRPVERGFIVQWDLELDIWKQAFFNQEAELNCDPHDTNLILTEAPNCPQVLQQNADQVIFEEFEFASACRAIGPTMNAYNDNAFLFGDNAGPSGISECLLVIDSGFSHTTVTPVYNGRALQSAVRRLDVGGKFLTSRLKELVSLRQFNLMDETHLVEQVKEDVSFVSQHFKADMEQAKVELGSTRLAMTDPRIVLDYVLPDYHTTFRGHVVPHESRNLKSTKGRGEQRAGEDALTLCNERFVTSELLFTPSDIGMAQAGIPEIAVQSLETLPAGLWPAMLANVLVVGGTSKLPGFVERLETELQSLVPTECLVRVRRPKDATKYTWLGGARLAADAEAYKQRSVTREEYQENGSAWTARRYLQY